ncbi:MAG: hypothetical protein AAF628_30145 [Planctomycetota bacterium]
MSTPFRSLALRTVFLAALGAVNLAAQDLNVDVVRDPRAGQAIYTATVQAPPGSRYWLFASAFTLTPPFQLPGFFGVLELDPLFALQVGGAVPVGPTGLGQFSFALPLAESENVELPFQAIVLDPARNLAFSSLATAIHGSEQREAAAGAEWVGGYSRRAQTYRMRFFNAAPGAMIEMKVNGVAEAQGIVGPNGTVDLSFQHALQQGDAISICIDGVHVRTWRWC